MNQCQVLTVQSTMFNTFQLLHQNLVTFCLGKVFQSNKILVNYYLCLDDKNKECLF